MKGRCKDLKVASHGAQGVSYDSRWEDFRVFLEEMGERPSGTTLDRLNPLRHYYKANCQWGSDADQARNKRAVEWLGYNNGTGWRDGTHPEWARLLSNRTGKAWTTKTLRETLKLLTLEQIMSGTSVYRLKGEALLVVARATEKRIAEEKKQAEYDEACRQADYLGANMRQQFGIGLERRHREALAAYDVLPYEVPARKVEGYEVAEPEVCDE